MVALRNRSHMSGFVFECLLKRYEFGEVGGWATRGQRGLSRKFGSKETIFSWSPNFSLCLSIVVSCSNAFSVNPLSV